MVEEINKLNANEQSQTTHNNMDESQVILREKKSGAKEYMLYDSFIQNTKIGKTNFCC